MRITPIDIQQQQFKSRLMGYDKAGVDQFLESLASEIERLFRQNQDLQEELAHTRSSLAEMREREATLKETLLTTQKVTDELKANARREAELLLADAEVRAERLMRNAEERRLQLIGEIQEIKRQKIDFETSLRCMLEKHVRMLELNVLSIGEEKADAKLLEEPLPFVGKATASPSASAAEPVAVAPSPVASPPRQRPAVAEPDELEFDIPLINDPGVETVAVTPSWLRPVPTGVELRILVQPRAGRDQLVGVQGDELKVRLAAPPVEGAANTACCAFLAKLCSLPKSRVTLVAGESSRHKRLLLCGAEPASVAAILAPLAGG